MVVKGYIADMDADHIYITAPFTDSWLVEKQDITECEIRLDDGRTISAEQRKKIYATLRDISLWSDHTPDELKALLKYDYIAHTGAAYFSLSDCDMTTANEFLNFILEFCLEQDIPLGDTLLSRSPDVARAVYAVSQISGALSAAQRRSCIMWTLWGLAGAARTLSTPA